MVKLLIIGSILIITAVLASSPETEKVSPEQYISGPLTLHGNSLLPTSPLPYPKVMQTINVVATAYSSTPEQTDEDPFITAAGTFVRDGIIANNYLPFGTKVRIPEIYGDKIFVVEDRMSWKKSNYHIDIWFPSYLEAKEFGAKRTYVEILES
ncbi:MAG: 3D domain-containing protein [Candidatus Nealsonbacteria bacterium]|nr:3D domain-containing protein [Candidatus Nealsonbacteria bacterium]